MTKEDYIDALMPKYLEFTAAVGPIMSTNPYKGLRMVQEYFETLYTDIYTQGFKDGAKILHTNDNKVN